MNAPSLSRRKFLALSSAALPMALIGQTANSAPVASATPPAPSTKPTDASPANDAKKYPIGLELYSVRDELGAGKDQLNVATLTAVAKMGYKLVEFWAPFYDSWTFPMAKEGRKLLDDLGLQCRSMHNSNDFFSEAKLPKVIEIGQIMGAKFMVMASAGTGATVDAWKKVADALTSSAEKLKPHGLFTGYHNHQTEWAKLRDGDQRAMDVLSANTPKEVMLQLDVGTCVMAGADPVAWIKANPGRINTVHCKEWGKAAGFNSIFGEGDSPWKDIFAAAENGGGVEYYLIEQEQAPRGQQLANVEKCLTNYKKMRA